MYNTYVGKLIIIRGYPGSGKTTIGKQLERKSAGKFIDHNAILTFIAGIVGNDDDIYEDIANLELAMTYKLLKGGNSVIVARGFSSLNSVKIYEDTASTLNVKSVVIRLDAPIDVLEERVSSPERLSDFNPTVTKDVLNNWINHNPIEDHHAEIIINNTESIGESVDEIITEITKLS